MVVLVDERESVGEETQVRHGECGSCLGGSSSSGMA